MNNQADSNDLFQTEERSGKAKGGKERARKLSPERRKEISQSGVEARRERAAARKELATMPKVTHGSPDHPLKIGAIEIQCYVLEDGTRVLSQRSLQSGIGMSTGGGSTTGEQRLAAFSLSLAKKANENSIVSSRGIALAERLKTPLKFNLAGKLTYGYEATMLADLCDIILDARTAGGILMKQQEHLAARAEMLVRGFARVGIIALVDEATGYQKDRARDALAKILEAYVAKELQPYIRTFDPDYYEYIFKLRGLPYPPKGEGTRPQSRPQYFGMLTNDIVYRRLAPGVLEALKEESKKMQKKGKLFQHLTAGYGRQELLKHLGLVVGYMKISEDWASFMSKLNKVAPRHDDTIPMDLDAADR